MAKNPKPYHFRGDPLKLDDIRRDLAALKILEHEAMLRSRAEEWKRYDRFIPQQDLMQTANQYNYRSQAWPRFWKAIQNFPYRRPAERLNVTTEGLFLGQLCHPSLERDEGRKGFAAEPGVGPDTVKLLHIFVRHYGGEIGGTPAGWSPPQLPE